MAYRLFLSEVITPDKCAYPDLMRRILARTESDSKRAYKTQARVLNARHACVSLLLEGLRQVVRASSWRFFESDRPIVVLCLPTSGHGYSHGHLKAYSHTAVMDILSALEAEGLVNRRPGYFAGEHKFQTAIWPTQALAAEMIDGVKGWEPTEHVKRELIVLKNYDPVTRKSYPIPFSPNAQTRQMERNLRRINKALNCSAISLACDDYLLWRIRFVMARPDYRAEHDVEDSPQMLDFMRVQLHRVFARKRFDLCGRFHGAWWEGCPSRFRRYVTINGQPTVELDYSAMHLRLAYAEANQTPPPGDLYDFGYQGPDQDRAREIFKKTVNAMINADYRGFRIADTDLRFLKMSQSEVVGRILSKHPLMKQIIGKLKGLHYQFIESRIAESVMLRLLDRGIMCLPIHDSFLVIQDYEDDLRQAMYDAHLEIVGAPPVIKAPEVAKTEFEPVLLPSGALDLTHLRNLQSASSVHQYLAGYYAHQAQVIRGIKTGDKALKALSA